MPALRDRRPLTPRPRVFGFLWVAKRVSVLASALLLAPFPSHPSVFAAGLPVYSDRQLVLELNQAAKDVWIATADFNGDGLLDIVVARYIWLSSATFELGILVNDGRGGFVDATATIFQGPVPRLQNPREIVIVDFNDDGRPDIFIADTGQDTAPWPGFQNTLVLSTLGGRLVDATAGLPQQSDYTHSACAADIDGDGDVDLYVGNIWGENGIPPQILLNDGTGRFTVAEDRLPASVTDLSQNKYTTCHFVDVNNDGFPDLVLGGEELPTPSVVLLNDGTGHFATLPNAFPPKPFAPTAIALDIQSADLNQDGYQDLLVAFTKANPFYQGRWIQVLINNGDGTFRDETPIRLPQSDNNDEWISFINLIDIDGDGSLDIATEVLSVISEQLPLFFLNNGRGFFSPVSLASGQLTPYVYVPLDAEGDGGRDFFTTDGAFQGSPERHFIVRDIGPAIVPGIPTEVTASRDRFLDRVRVGWEYVWGAARYEVWRSTSPGTPGSLVATTTKTMLDDTTVTPGLTYYYSVRAVNAAGASAFGYPALQNPTLALSLNQASFQRGEILTITAQVTPGATPTPVDAYVAITLPGGTLLFLQGGGNFTTDLRPIVTNWTAAPFRGEVFRYTFGGGEPGGNYTWYAAFTEPGTLNFIGGIVQAPFSFSP